MAEELLNIKNMVDRQMEEFSANLNVIKASLQPGDEKSTAVSLGLLEAAFKSFRSQVQGEFAEVGRRLADMEVKYDSLESYSRRNCLLVFGVPEAQAKDEHESERAVLEIFNTNLGLSILPDQIDRAHRLGRVKSAAKPRPIIVKFCSYRTRREVFLTKKNLKGLPFRIGESLTRTRLAILNKARDVFGVQNCWTSDGKILVKDETSGDAVRHVITTMDRLEEVIKQRAGPAAPRGRKPGKPAAAKRSDGVSPAAVATRAGSKLRGVPKPTVPK
ncbi:hypothetical protein M8J76_015159 [Diaphorina citri]|nr:hypothetical protein M8J75_003274 [Diaphorina citri]KAI5693255.1 hypothetical protein M8J75_012064 [Diaphorina citri]KAI5696655.1 hypothetical protein M8J75_015929 [Diaphorina citri]KAI5708398.1 hypothetical protein M8J77_021910 [Diaphorina citri]KAI5709375.1 hypothetical protein M8J76_016681 [Diaphorina citri]